MNLIRVALGCALLALVASAGAQTAQRKSYIVQLADAPAATYNGGRAGLAATRPARGAKLDMRSPQVRAYLSHLNAQQSRALSRIGAAPVLYRYGVAFNGFAVRLTEAQAKSLKTAAGVVAVTESKRFHLDTTRTPDFLGLTAPGGLWSQLDAASRPVQGEDVILGIVDSGVWPENPSFGDKVDGLGNPVAYDQPGTLVYGAPPAKWLGRCDVGPGFSANMCNNKLIGARWYVAEFDQTNPGASSLHDKEFRSPRDGAGHGTHTASTAGGNAGVTTTIFGVGVGRVSGMAPRARIAAYKVCWEGSNPGLTGCYSADIVAAINQAVADGVDVINFSISGTRTDLSDPHEIAFLNAASAGIFVAASAGNTSASTTVAAGQVAHPGPWLTTVAASTHDRYTAAQVTLGAPSGQSFSGVSYQGAGLPSRPLIMAWDAGPVPFASMTPTDQLALMRCYNPADRADPTLFTPAAFAGTPSANAALEPARVAGKIVVCIRGGNVLVNKAASVKSAGGAGLIILDAPDGVLPGLPATSNTPYLQPYVLPTVHLPNTAYDALTRYAASTLGAASAAFGPGVQVAGTVAPVMANFSLAGPSQANANLLKPDLTAPGVDVIAAYIDDAMTQAEHDGIVAGNFRARAAGMTLQGTSMSSPHVAGVAALLRQQHPGWSPAAIKSALMTSAGPVRLATGSLDPDRWRYGAGHVAPNAATDPGLVYDIQPADYGRLLCGLNLTPPAGLGNCGTLGALQPWDLNLPSLSAAAVPATLTLNRRVTNVGNATATYVATATLPGWSVQVNPSTLTLAPGASAAFTATLVPAGAPVGGWTFGDLSWSDGTHTVRSPLSARAVSFVAPAEVSDTRVSGRGTKVFSITSAYTGTLTVSATGLVPATRSAGVVDAADAAAPAQRCVDFTVGAGAQVARWQLFNADTEGGGAGTDLDLDVYDAAGGLGNLVGASGRSQSNEVVTLALPAAGTYSACVVGYATPISGARYTLSSWVVGPAVGTQTLKASGPTAVYAGGSASIGLGWSVPAGVRYLGNVHFRNGSNALIGSTIVSVDNH